MEAVTVEEVAEVRVTVVSPIDNEVYRINTVHNICILYYVKILIEINIYRTRCVNFPLPNLRVRFAKFFKQNYCYA